ncbi:MAG: SCO family protein [Aquabacterium sp.]|nr:SCO family protein [Aquabacterium sp.]
MQRRKCLKALTLIGGLGSALGSGPSTAQIHTGPGPVTPPLPAPDLPFTDHLGRPQNLRQWMSGQVTAVQTIFTGCSSVCPIQGALFAAAQRQLAGQALRQPTRWLSISIDPLGDTPELLRAWLQRTGTPPAAWVAALPRLSDVDRLRRGLDGINATAAQALDAHSDKVYFFDAQAQLRWRTASLPTVADVARVVAHLAG